MGAGFRDGVYGFEDGGDYAFVPFLPAGVLDVPADAVLVFGAGEEVGDGVSYSGDVLGDGIAYYFEVVFA